MYYYEGIILNDYEVFQLLSDDCVPQQLIQNNIISKRYFLSPTCNKTNISQMQEKYC